MSLVTLVLLSAVLATVPRPARAETYQTCAGFIDSLPATISTQGTWCLRKDLSTAMASGAAITIATNNVTIDCNDFKLGGLAAGDGTTAAGIRAISRINATVRNCSVRGFMSGIEMSGAGHAVLDSRFDNNTYAGLIATGDGVLVRGNRVQDTGGSTQPGYASPRAIFVSGDAGTVTGNLVQGVVATPASNGHAYGVVVYLLAGDVADNVVAVLRPDGTGEAHGISNFNGPAQLVMRDNVVSASALSPIAGTAMHCSGATARDNSVAGFTAGYDDCDSAGGNFIK